MSTTTAAVVTDPGGAFELQELALEAPRPGEVLVEIAAAGICHTDIVVRDGAMPIVFPGVFGHEAVGRVVEIGFAQSSFSPGDRVGLSYASCGSCERCLHGHASSCTSWMVLNMMGARLDGSTALSRGGEPIHSHFFGQSSFATRAVVLESSLVPMPDDVPDEIAAVLGCGVQTGAGAVMNVLKPPAGSSIAVFGAGTVGLSAVMAAAIVGCGRIIAIDLHGSRLELAQELGATDVIQASEGLDVAAKIFELTGTGAGYALETTGAPSVLPVAVYSTGIGGTTGLIGAAPAGTELGVDVAAIMALCKTVVGIMEGDAVPRTFIPQLIEHWRGGRLPLERLVQTFPFAEINDAVAASLSGNVIKPVLTMA